MTTWIGLLRGINVGKAKRLAMADLRRLVEDAGYSEARTLLNSGNVVFRGKAEPPARIAARIERGIETAAGFQSRVVILSARTLAAIAEENPLAAEASDPARLMVLFVPEVAALEGVRPLSTRNWGDERVAVGTHAAYVWSPRGVLESAASEAVGRVLGDRVTARNWATVQKLVALAGSGRD